MSSVVTVNIFVKYFNYFDWMTLFVKKFTNSVTCKVIYMTLNTINSGMLNHFVFHRAQGIVVLKTGLADCQRCATDV